jgi:predicted peptidase
MTQQPRVFETEVTKRLSLGYLLHMPPGYGDDVAQKWPLILYLHGAGERGHDLERLKVNGIPRVIEEHPEFPFVTISPQCPAESWWSQHLDALVALLDDVVERYAVDPGRIYLTGLSMGGYGSWSLSVVQPQRFAAVVPICGGLHAPARFVCILKDVPVWAFHGAKDTVVPLEESLRLVRALQECGGNVRLTVYPDAGHDSWTSTYDDPALYDWLLQQTQ